ncbi:MAG: guanine deaminase [Gammaproteobacteria bacterium]|nr:guanine deaminase [Gammaproteobacteria bacterium]
MRAIRAAIVHCRGEPEAGNEASAIEYFDDGVLVLEGGRVVGLGSAEEWLASPAAGVTVEDRRGYLLVPGFVDTHIHYPQTDIIAGHGKQLMDWLEHYVWPIEARFNDQQTGAATAEFFLDELLRNGTTTACVFGTVHVASIDTFMAAALRRGMRMIAGKVLMDRNCPETLREDAGDGIGKSAELIERWHGKGRLAYALTPRFAPTSSPQLLQAISELLRSQNDLYLQTHLAECQDETRLVAELFPESSSYLGVYDQFGLVIERSVFAHGIHIDHDDRRRMAQAGSAISFCPTSNMFLGSGLFNYQAAKRAGIRVGLGSDVGAGTRFGISETAAEAYKVCRLRGDDLHPFEAFYLATLGGARALRLDDSIGNFENGKEADFVLLDYNATPLLARRTAVATDLEERLFALMMLADDRAVAETYVMGERVHERS